MRYLRGLLICLAAIWILNIILAAQNTNSLVIGILPLIGVVGLVFLAVMWNLSFMVNKPHPIRKPIKLTNIKFDSVHTKIKISDYFDIKLFRTRLIFHKNTIGIVLILLGIATISSYFILGGPGRVTADQPLGSYGNPYKQFLIGIVLCMLGFIFSFKSEQSKLHKFNSKSQKK